MLKKSLLLLLLSFSNFIFSQESKIDSTQSNNKLEDRIVLLKGQIVNGYNQKPLENAHVFNMNTIKGTSTDVNGSFTIPTRVNDTIFLSHIGFQSVKIKITNDLLKGNELEIALFEKSEDLKEVTIKSTDLIGVLEIDAKNVPTDKYARIHINGLPQTYEVGSPRSKSYKSPVDAVFHPLDFMHSHFGKKPKELKKLQSMRDDDEIRKLLDSKMDRELMLGYLDLSVQELEELLNECNYSEYFIKTASDIQIIEAVLQCYDNYKAVKQGSTKKKN